MKTILAAALILALGITGLLLLGAVHGQRMSVSSSQIYVDGTPVCVLRHGRDIIASVGMCDTPGGESADDGFGKGGVFNRGTPYHQKRHLGLPPGHPPIGLPPDTGEERRILI